MFDFELDNIQNIIILHNIFRCLIQHHIAMTEFKSISLGHHYMRSIRKYFQTIKKLFLSYFTLVSVNLTCVNLKKLKYQNFT